MLPSSAISRSLRTVSRGARNLSAQTPEQLDATYLLGNYGAGGVRFKEGLVIERGEKSTLFDTRGNSYVDFFAGIAVNALGHSDPGIAEAITKQAMKIQHVSNLVHTQEGPRLAQQLLESAKSFDKVYFCNSGTEANEGAYKFARKYHLAKALKETGKSFTGPCPNGCSTKNGVCSCWPQSLPEVASKLKPESMAFKKSFHGRTMGSLSLTYKPAIRWPFGPFPSDVHFATFNDIESVHKLWNDRIGAVFIEPVQGEGGINPANKDFMRDLRALCDEKGALLIVDEIQVGLGRSGYLWAHEMFDDFKPDMMTLAKPLAGGLPIGAVLMNERVASAIAPGDHGTTFGGNPFVCAVASHVFSRISNPDFLAESRKRGKQLVEGCRAIAAKYPDAVKEVRQGGEGLFVGVELKKPFKDLQMAACDRGLLIISCGDNTIRICPPLNISEEDVEKGLRILDESFKAAF